MNASIIYLALWILGIFLLTLGFMKKSIKLKVISIILIISLIAVLVLFSLSDM